MRTGNRILTALALSACLVGGLALLGSNESWSQSLPAAGPPDPGPEFAKLLRKPLWVIQTRLVAGANLDAELIRAHLKHQRDLEKRGIMFGAGPVTDENGQFLYGLIIIRAADREAAMRIADSDPMHASKKRTYTLQKWTLNEGRMSVSVDFSDGTYKFD